MKGFLWRAEKCLLNTNLWKLPWNGRADTEQGGYNEEECKK